MATVNREHVKQALAVLVVVLTVAATIGAAEYRQSLDVGPEEVGDLPAADCQDAGSQAASDDGSDQAEESSEQCPDTVATTGAS